tara:strand:+ start:267 stop:1589 length:1323 start_codon:yes stop_codon:yes gene_type:complete
MALTKVSTDGVKDDAVTTDKLANAINTERTANTAKVSTTINNNADNRLITGSGTANTLNGEAGLTYDSGGMAITGDSDRDGLKITQSGNNYGEFMFNSNRSSSGNALGVIRGEWNSTEVASIYLTAGSDTTNKDDGQIRFFTSPDSGTGIQTRMLIDSSGHVGIGGTVLDPTEMLELQGSNNGVTDPKSSVNTLRFRCNDSTTTNNQPMGTILWTTNDSGNSSGNAAFISTIDADQTGNGILVFGAGNEAAEKMRIDGSGRFHLGTTGVGGGLGGVRLRNPDQGTSRFGSASSGQITYIQFINNNGNSITGSITGNASSTSFNTSSDYRLKENESPISDGITRLKQLKPYKFNWKSDSSTKVDGFFAHEVSSIVPEAITGTKDAIAVQDDVDKGIADALGEPIYQTIDHAKLVPLLTAALQEAVGKIETLETKVAALEAT